MISDKNSIRCEKAGDDFDGYKWAEFYSFTLAIPDYQVTPDKSWYWKRKFQRSVEYENVMFTFKNWLDKIRIKIITIEAH